MHKVLHMLNYLGNGGTEKYIYSLGKILHGNKCEFFTAYSEDGPGKSLFEELGINLLPLQMNSPFDIKAAIQLKKMCKRLSIDIVHTHFLRENYIAIMSKILGNNVRIINTRHMLIENTKCVALANRMFTKCNYKVIAVSGHVRDSLIKEGIKEDSISMIHHGVDADEWSTPIKSSFRKNMGIANDEILITSVSRCSPEKGHSFMIEVIKYFRDNKKIYCPTDVKYRFILAGVGPTLGELKEKAKEYDLEDSIIFAGHVDNVKEMLRSSDVFIAHSKSEAFGIAILEAMASGLPVITTNSGGTAEIVNEAHGNGIIVDYGNIQKYAESLALLVNNRELRKQYAENGLATIRNHFSLEKTANETYNLYVANEKSREGDGNDR